jgi:hypothetical protein
MHSRVMLKMLKDNEQRKNIADAVADLQAQIAVEIGKQNECSKSLGYWEGAGIQNE